MSKLTKKINTVYVEPRNHVHAIKAKTAYGSTSAYINHLIAKDRGVKTVAQGHWKPKASAK